MIKIAVDCFGGDHSPDANIDGALLALAAFPDLSVILSGDEDKIKAHLATKKYDEKRLSILHAPEVIGCDEKPTDAIRLKKESSMMKAVRLLREDETVSGIVSTGSTGALVVAATLRIGRLSGVIRPAFCPIMPTMNGGVVGVCDSGANVDITPDYLQQYAIMGSLYMKKVYGMQDVRVALLNVGTEKEKGDELRKAAYALLSETPGIHFVGNMESRDLLSGKYDLVVCDGFAGNVLIKSTEGAAMEMLKKLKRDISSRLLYKLGALFMLKMFKDEKKFMDYRNYGGSVLLGTKKVVVKGHGSSNDVAVFKCIEQAYRMEVGALPTDIEASLAALPVKETAQSNA
ncbi:MAG: phosphate acyltransferase PlsX [Clostridia bacterium]|nr:phosphate acyltransferase PlsX [Clostridia bacterium]